MTSNLSAEGQHLIDALETHMVAVKNAVKTGTPELLAEVEAAWDTVLDHLDATGAKFRAAAQSRDAASAPAAGAALGSAGGGLTAADVAIPGAGKPASIGELATANTSGSASVG